MLYYTFKFIYDLVKNHARGVDVDFFARQGFDSFMHTPIAPSFPTEQLPLKKIGLPETLSKAKAQKQCLVKVYDSLNAHLGPPSPGTALDRVDCSKVQ